MLGSVVTNCLILLVVAIMVVGVSPTPPPPVRAGVLAVVAGLVVSALWLRRRDRRSYERALTREVAARAVAEDRLVIARELHDVVSGSLGAITVRSAVAQRLETGPEGLRRALHDVEETSREATDGLRRMLSVLREDSAPSTPEDPKARTGGWTPRAGGAGGDGGVVEADLEHALARAVRRARRAGVTVEVEVEDEADDGSCGIRGVRGARPSGVGEVMARVVEEALTNTVRHAGPTRARVVVRQEGARLRVAVVDDGPAPGWEPRPGAGQGLRGLRERVEALGGTLTAGAGFSVEAVLPLPSFPSLLAALPDRGGGPGDHPAAGPAGSFGTSSSPSPEHAEAGSRHG